MQEWFDGLARELNDRIVGLVPPVPEQVTAACSAVQEAASEWGVLSHFVPWWALAGIAIVVSIVVAVIAIRVIRMVISLFSGGGGA